MYRAKVAETTGKAFSANRELNRQLAILAQTAKTRKLPVVVTSQVRSVFNDTYASVAPDTIIAMKPTENPQTIKAVLEQKGEKAEETACYLRIDETGIHDCPFS